MKDKESVVEMSKDVKKPVYTELLKDDKKCVFYTNIPKLTMFVAIHHDIVKLLARNLVKRSKVKMCNSKKKDSGVKR